MNANANQPNHTKPVTGSRDRQQPHASGSAITRAIREADRRMRERFPVLRHQTALGMGFVLLGFGIAAASTWLFLAGNLPAWACILTNAVAFAVLREIEHDLIHNLYFKGKRTAQNLVLFIIWPALGNVPSPLYRRMMHLQHHRSSGREDDLEERLIGNGTGFGPMRWLAMLDTGLSTLFRRRELDRIPGFRRGQLLRHLMPVVAIFYIAWVSFLIYHGLSLGMWLCGFASKMPAWLASLVPMIDAIAVIWVLPNVIRQASLQILSSTMHYYGDVQGVMQQTQVLTKWYWQPLQLLSCNFGRSHAIHHFVVNQPFYLRELVRRDAHAAMRKHGVRFDDLGTFKRANSWGASGEVRSEGSVPEAGSSGDCIKESVAQDDQSLVSTEPKKESRPELKADILFLELQGRLDAITAAELEKTLVKSIDSGARRLAIDFSKLDHISDTGLRVLLRVAKRLMQTEGKLALHSLNNQIKQVFDQTGFSLIFPIHLSLEAAVRGLSSTGCVTVF